MSKLTMDEIRAARDPEAEAAMRKVAKRIREQWLTRWALWPTYITPEREYERPEAWPPLFGKPGESYSYWLPRPRYRGDICMWSTRQAPDGKFWACKWKYHKSGKHAGRHVLVRSSFKVFRRRKDAKAHATELRYGKA